MYQIKVIIQNQMQETIKKRREEANDLFFFIFLWFGVGWKGGIR